MPTSERSRRKSIPGMTLPPQQRRGTRSPRHHLRGADAGDERLAAGAADGPLLAGPQGRGLGQAFGMVDRSQRLDRAAAAGQLGRALGSLGRAAPAPLAGGLDPQPRELRLGAPRDGVAVGLAADRQVPADPGQLPRGGHHGHVAGLLPQQAAEEVAQRTGIFVQVLCGLDEHPPRQAVAPLRNRAVVAMVGGLPRRRRQAQVTSRMITIGEALHVAPGGHHRGSCNCVHAGQRHQQPHPLALVAAAGQLAVEQFDLRLQGLQLPQIAVHQQPRLVVELHCTQPFQALVAEESLPVGHDQPHRQAV